MKKDTPTTRSLAHLPVWDPDQFEKDFPLPPDPHPDLPSQIAYLIETIRKIDASAGNCSSPDEVRELAIDAMYAVMTFAPLQEAKCGHIFSEVVQALFLLRVGKMHPLLAANERDRGRARRWQTISEIQASAAAVLEYCFTDLGSKQRDVSNSITLGLAKIGLRSTQRARQYDGDAVRKWRTACIRGRHASQGSYEMTLVLLRFCLPRSQDVDVLIQNFLAQSSRELK
jgi:hypothetical protein